MSTPESEPGSATPEATASDAPASEPAAPDTTPPDTTVQSGTEGDNLGPNVFADNRRRLIPGVSYVVIGALCVMGWLVRMGDDPVLINSGMMVAGVLLIVFGAFGIVTAWSLDVDEEAALCAAAVAVGRPMGHASAQMGWRGWLSRPTWRILWYSAENPPRHRGIVFVDGHDGTVLDSVSEPNPEVGDAIDWDLDS